MSQVFTKNRRKSGAYLAIWRAGCGERPDKDAGAAFDKHLSRAKDGKLQRFGQALFREKLAIDERSPLEH